VGDDLQHAVRQGEQMMQDTANDVGEKAAAVRAQLSSAIEAAKDAYEKLKDKAITGAKATDRAVREHPYPSLGIAFAAGLLIGFLCNRK
jgi:ElaB/YqjD/DUF883 family membrane-anchored ribosome-binding protein